MIASAGASMPEKCALSPKSPVVGGRAAPKAALPSAMITKWGENWRISFVRRSRARTTGEAPPSTSSHRCSSCTVTSASRAADISCSSSTLRGRPHISRGRSKVAVSPEGVTKMDRRSRTGRSDAIASARPRRVRTSMPSALRHSPQTLSRGNRFCSRRVTRQRRRASRIDATLPAGPAPMITTSRMTSRADGFLPVGPLPQGVHLFADFLCDLRVREVAGDDVAQPNRLRPLVVLDGQRELRPQAVQLFLEHVADRLLHLLGFLRREVRVELLEDLDAAVDVLANE